MKRMSIGLFFAAALFALVLGLSACQKSDDAAQTVQAYLLARAQSDETQMINLSCADWEAQARTEAASFKSMNAKLDGVTCQVSSGDANTALVSCQGKIVTAYNGETRDWPLTGRQFKLVHQQGEWRMCGYQ
jgi:hypothetical protein